MDKDINMKRLCIYVTYNKENEIKEYMGYMLKALRGYTTTLYVVCNYLKISDGSERIVPYADDIFYRRIKDWMRERIRTCFVTLSDGMRFINMMN